MRRILGVTAIAFILSVAAGAQVTTPTTGIPPFGSFSGGPFDMVNNANLNVHFEIPIVSRSGRGLPFTYLLSYDSSIYYQFPSGGHLYWGIVPNFGWRDVTEASYGYVSYNLTTPSCTGGNKLVYNAFVYHDSHGTTHQYPSTATLTDSSDCTGGSGSSGIWTATDNSGFQLSANTAQLNGTNAGAALVITKSGTVLAVPTVETTGTTGLGSCGAGTAICDQNGNFVSASATTQGSTTTTTFTDTLGTTALTAAVVSPPSSSTPNTYTYTSTEGSESVKVNFSSQTVESNFGCSSVYEYVWRQENLVSSIDLPDGTSYAFTYEPTPGDNHNPHWVTGRIASATLPTGATITYTYTGSNNGINCADGSAAGLIRTTPDGTWTYTRAAGPPASTTVQDPMGNQTVIDFQSIYETERNAYKSTSSGTLLETVDTCYDAVTPPCTSGAVGLPITSRGIWTTLTGTTNMQSEVATDYNALGFPTEVDEYGYTSNLLRKTLTTYQVFNGLQFGQSCIVGAQGDACFEQPMKVQVYDEQSGSPVLNAQTTYSYSSTVTSSSGTPQHTTPPGDRGNLVQINYSTAGSNSLSKSFTYYDTGVVNTATDVNSAVTTYNYPNATSTCGNAFPTNVTLPITYRYPPSTTWDCNGTVPLSTTDVNNQQTTYVYADPFSRLTKETDPTGAITTTSYGDVSGAFNTESVLTFNGGASTVDTLATMDGLGRPIISQRRQAPGSTNFDSVQTTYDSLGRPASMSMPYQETAGQAAPSGTKFTTYTYDALSRPATITDGGGGEVSYTYNERDVLKTISPAPSGENTKNWQYEYDGRGYLISVCEITSVGGSGACNQTASATGFSTTYGYNALGELTGSTQSAQSSSPRAYSYDLLGRMATEVNPESGTTSYYYSTDSTCGTSYGDLVKKVDAAGNVICYAYDALHRLTAETQHGGPAAARYYLYDSATVNGVAMQNVEGRLAQACTGGNSPPNACSGSMITNLGFQYSARGELTDTFTWTSQSGGWYHVCQTYRQEPGLPYVLSLYGTADTNCTHAGLIPAITYGADGEGRLSTVSPASGQSPVTGVTYNNGSQTTQVNYGSGDSDAFSYDPKTGRMKQYQFNVGSQSMTGALTWNQNGTLQQLAITDPFNSSDQQTCNYTYDDLARINTANCGSGFSQTFGIGALGNLTKTGTFSFSPTYNGYTNQITSVGGQSYAYDADGDLTSTGTGTGTNAYTWDAFGKMTSDTPSGGSSIGIDYDALGRPAMTNVNGASYTEFVYAPDGSKLALMNGQTLYKARVSLPGGGTAIYDPTGLVRYWHSDWQGTMRLVSNPSSPTYYWSGAYAPYGETYALGSNPFVTDFASLMGDTSGELDDAMFRKYNPTEGRWMNPDPAGLAAVDLTNPQSLNRYSYVMNNPLSFLDPMGLCGGSDYSYEGNGMTNVVGDGPCPIATLGMSPGGGGCSEIYLDGMDEGPSCGSGGGIGGGLISNFPQEPSSGTGTGTPTPKPAPQPLAPKPSRQPVNAQEVYQQCVSDFHNSTLGKVVQFGSLFSFRDDFVGTAETWGEALFLKGAVLGAFFKGANSAAGGLSPVTEFLTPIVEGGGEAGIALATAADAAVRNGCYAAANPDLYQYQYKAVF